MKRFCLFLFSLVIFLSSVNAEDWDNYAMNSSEGTEFYVTFLFNGSQPATQTLSLQLFMSARQSTNVQIYESGNGSSLIASFTVNGNTCWSYPNGINVYQYQSHNVSHSVRVVADNDISLYAASSNGPIGDATLILPVNRMDKEYVVQTSQTNASVNEFAVIATKPGTTTLTITPSADVSTGLQSLISAGTPYTIQLTQGQVYYATATDEHGDLSGTLVCGDKNIAVFNGCQSAYIQGGYRASHVYHQALPINLWGTQYPVVQFEGFTCSVVKFTALYNGTVLYKNGVQLATLNAFESYNYIWNDGQTSAYFETSKQAACYQYMPGNNVQYGGPAMSLVTSLPQAVSSMKISTYQFTTASNYIAFVNIVVPTAAVNSMMIDTVYVGSQFSPMSDLPGYSFARIQVTAGEHELTNAGGKFTAMVYAMDDVNISYVYNAGLNCLNQYAYFLLDGQRVPKIAICQDSDSLWHFTATSVIQGDYDHIEWYDEYKGDITYMGSDSIWHAALTTPKEHNIYMKVVRTTPVCEIEETDTIEAEVYDVPRVDTVTQAIVACKTDVIVVFGDTISCDTLTVNKSYSYRKTFADIYGCDSLVTQPVVVLDRSDSTFNVSICEGEEYTFHDSVYTETGTYIALDSIGHCTYTDTLNLTVNPIYRFTYTDTVCLNELPYKWRDVEIIDTSGVHIYHDSLKTEHGCDSLFELILTIGEVYLITDTVFECENHDPYEWHGGKYSVTGVYYDSLVSRFGCDSVHRLILTVSPSYFFADTTSVCSNDDFVWRDSLYHGFEPGVVVIYDSLTSKMGCDSVYAMVLNVRPADIFYTDTAICDNEYLFWREHMIMGNKAKELSEDAEIVASGFHLISDSLINEHSCDSIYHLRLNVRKSYDQTIERVICQGDSFMFDNQMLTWHNDIVGEHDSAVFYVTQFGCDSILNLHLTVNPVYNIEHYDTVCNNNSYHWYQGEIDTTITERTAGTYEYQAHFQSVNGCDSTHILHLTVLDTVGLHSIAFIPDKGSYTWDNKTYCGSMSTDACDTVLKVSPTPYFFRHVYTAANGCDSILTLTIQVDSTYDRTLNVTTCQHEDYSFNGKTWSWKKDIPGDHDTVYTYVSIAGYDSIWRLHVHVNPVYMFQQSDSTCRNVPYNWVGRRRTYQNLTPGVHLMYDSLYSKAGCDSIYELALTVLDTAENVVITTLADNKSMVWDGMVIAGSKYHGAADVVLPDGVYEYHRTYTSKSCGCDSVMHLYLTVSYTFEDSVKLVTCQHDDYMFNGQLWSWRKDIAGEHDTAYLYKSKSGVDSVWRLHLKVNPVYLIPETQYTCQNTPFVWTGHNKTFSNLAPGTYTFYDSLKSVNANCDSIHELTLVVHDTVEHTHYLTMCDNDTLVWDGQLFRGDKSEMTIGTVCPYRFAPYVFEHAYKTVLTDCDSIERLVLYVKPTYEFVLDTSLCTKYGFEYRDSIYKDSGTYYDSLKSVDGCDSVYVLNLQLDLVSRTRQYIGICEGDSFFFRGKAITKPGVYIDSLISVVGGCDSVIELRFDILPTYYIRDTIQLCDGDSFDFHGRIITYPGVFYDSHQTTSGCDSTYELVVKMAHKFHDIKYDTVCSNQVYHWRNKWFTESGVYFDSIASTFGCDSVYELRLTMFTPSIHEQYAEICSGGSFDFRGKQVTQPGVYYDTLYSVHGCDSIYKLVLNFAQTFYYRDTARICDGDSLDFHGRIIKNAGVYYDSYKTVSGCDSIYELFVKVAPKFHDIKYDTVCSNKVYHWRNKWLTEGGTYFDSLKSSQGCDSVYELRLAMFRPSVHEQYAEVCQGGSFNFRGRPITQPGTYYDTLTSVHGCDSIYKLVLNFTQKYYYRDTVQICDGSSYKFHGRILTHAGTYYDSLKTASGCDSIYELFVKVAPKFHDIKYDTVCSNKVYHWRNKWFTEGGTYFDSLKSSQGCDSVYELRLAMFRPSVHEQYAEVCQGGSFNFRGRPITQPGTYYDTLTNVHGCDSIYKLVFNFAKKYYSRDTTQICDGEVYTWRGMTINRAGTYRDTLKTVRSGCDSIYEIFVKVAPKFHDIAYDTLCSINSYHWRGKWLTETGIYFDSLVSSHGCDSVYEMRLTMYRPSTHEEYIEVCEGGSFNFRGRPITQPGTYYDTLTNVHGCDSIYKLVFNFAKKYYFRDTTQICDGEVYTWRGMTINRAGTYRDTLKTVRSGCDSIYEIFVKVAPKFHDIAYDTVCSNNTYHWRGKWLTETGTYFDSLKSSQGCDSVYEMRLTMFRPSTHEEYIEVCEGGSFNFRGRPITQPGTYYDTLTNVHGCDSIYKLVFNFAKKYYFRDTTQICDGEVYTWRGMTINRAGTYRDTLKTVRSGCDSIYEIFVKVAPKFHDIAYDTVCSNNTYHWRGKWLTETGTYFDSLKSSQGCDSVYEMRIVIGTPTVTDFYIEVCEGDSFYFRGSRIAEPGVYCDTLVSRYGCDSIIKLVFNVTRKYHFFETKQICDGEVYNWRGRNVNKAGTYRDSLSTAISGCDSIYELFLIVAPKFHHIAYDTVCSDSVYHWRGKWLTASGTYFDTLLSTQGCDSVYELRLLMGKPSVTEHYVEVCEGDSFYFRGRRIAEPGVYCDTLLSRHGCDSIIKLVFNVTRRYHFYQTIQICDGGVYNWRGRNIHKPGTYRDTLKTAISGCDSIYELTVNVAPKFHNISYDTLCTDQPYLWRGKWLTTGGTYFDSIVDSQGCDSVYEFRLVMGAPSVTEHYIEVCEGDSFYFRGRRISEPGIYYDTLLSRIGCDSVIKLVFNVTRKYHFYETKQICDGGVYLWRGRNIHKAGTYRDTLQTVISGCDSIYELFVTVAPRFHNIEYDTICSTQTYLWRGKWLTETGVYFDSILSTQGCDSVYEMRLTMYRPTVHEQYVEVCNGGSFNFRGKHITQPGTYYDTLVNVHGCDSIYKLVFNYAKTYYFYDTVLICDGDYYDFRGRNITYAGTYRDTLKTVRSGCDSIYEIFVKVAPKFHNIEYDTVCSNQAYPWRGKWLTATGTYFDTLKTHFGCDSVYEMRLTMYTPSIYEKYVEVCEGSTYNFRGRQISEPGIYYDTLISTHGYDSVFKLIINFVHTYYFRDTTYLCDGDIYNFRGKPVTQGGTYRDTLKTVVCGCDSIYEVFVNMAPRFHDIAYDTLCSLQSYHWRGKWLSATGTYFDTLRSHYGCDSVYEMRLTMYRPTVHEEYVEVCSGGSFNFRGRHIAQPGTYYDTLTNVHGCDSIYKLVFNFAKTYYFRDTTQICDGDAYNFRGRVVTQAGTYRDTLKTIVSGCDSIYELFVRMAPKFHNIAYDTLCSDSVYHWRGKWLTESGTYFDSIRSTQGCDSVYELRLIMGHSNVTELYVEVCEGDSFAFRGSMIYQPGVYCDTLVSRHGCDSIVKLVFNITRKYHFYESVEICQGSVYNWHGRNIHLPGTYFDKQKTVNSGCDSIYELFVTVAPKYHFVEYDTVCSNQTYTWRGNLYTATGVYYDSIMSTHGCDSVYELRLTVNQSSITTLHQQLCYGNVITFNGKRITQPGVYFDTLMRSSNGCDSIVKLVVSISPDYLFEDTAYICKEDSFLFRGKYYNLPGTYFDIDTQAAPLCDKVYKLVLKNYSAFHDIKDTTVCSNDVLMFAGQRITASGTYFDNYKSRFGCDSIYQLNVTIKQATYYTEYVDICPNQVYRTPTGKRLNRRGLFNDTLLNRHGCDSIITFNVNVYDNYRLTDTLAICRGGSGVARNGLTYSAPGNYVDTVNRNASNGCDTIFLTHVYYDSIRISMPVTLCNGQVFSFRGHNYSQPGVYPLFIQSTLTGVCDTLYTITVNVLPVPVTVINDSTCDNQPYWFFGRSLTQSGSYRDSSLVAANGCDSVIILNLSIRDSLKEEKYATICEKDSLLWLGSWYKYDGVYHVTTVDAKTGCNVYNTLYLTTIKETQLISVADADMCQDEDYYILTPSFSGNPPSRFTLRYDGVTVPSSNDIIDEWFDGTTIQVPIPLMNDGNRVRPDNYSVTLQIGSSECGMGKQTMNLNLLVRYPSSVLEQHFNDVISVLNHKHNGGYNFSDFRWYVNGYRVANANGSNFYDVNLAPYDVVYAELRRAGETYFIPTCAITVADLGPEDVDYPILVVTRPMSVQVTVKDNASYRLCTATGIILKSGEFVKDEEVELALPYVAGCYFLVVDNDSAGRKIFKLIVH